MFQIGRLSFETLFVFCHEIEILTGHTHGLLIFKPIELYLIYYYHNNGKTTN